MTEVAYVKVSEDDSVSENDGVSEAKHKLGFRFVSIWQCQQCIREGNNRHEQYDKEGFHVIDDHNNQSDKISVAFEDSEEIQELEPHEEDSNSLYDSLSFLSYVNVRCLDTNDSEDSSGRDDINVVPNGS